MISRVMAIKTFFEKPPHAREVTRKEFVDLHRDPPSYEWVAQECAKALGEILEEKKA